MNTLIDVTGKLPRGLVEMYRKVDVCAKGLGIDYLIVGAMARDLVMHHGFGAHIERGTRNVDFAIQVASWQEFNTLKYASFRPVQRIAGNDRRYPVTHP